MEIERTGGAPVAAEVIGFRDDLTLVAPLGDLQGVYQGSSVRLRRTPQLAARRPGFARRVINATGHSDRRSPGAGACWIVFLSKDACPVPFRGHESLNH